MKLYTFPQAPSPRRVHLFIAEKGLEIEQETIDLRKGEHLEPEYAGRNPACTVPALELDDGTCLSECVAICRYLEEIQPDPPLFGRNALERALTVERDHWVEMNGTLAVVEAFRNSEAWMQDRALPGSRPVARIPELAERGRLRYGWFLEDLDGILAESEYVAGEAFSVADITALVTVDFARWAIKTEMPDSVEHVRAWHEKVSARDSVRSGS